VGLFKNSFGKSLGNKITISVSEALAFCNENKYEITKQGLIYIGKKEGWIEHNKDKFHLRIIKKGLLEHILRSRDKVPWGWVLVSSMSKFAKNESEYYRVLNKSGIEIRIYGREKKRYGKKEDIKRIFRQHRKSNTKSKKEKDKYK
jgi:hypothetical protein